MTRKLWSISKLAREKTHARRKIFAVLLSLVMCGTMVFGGAGAVFADEGAQDAPKPAKNESPQSVAPSDAGGSISGTVTAGGSSLAGISVTVYKLHDENSGWAGWYGTSYESYTDSNGAYTFTELEAGEYRIGFRDTQGKVYIHEYYSNNGNAYRLEDGDSIIVDESHLEHTYISEQLDVGGTISGTVTGESGPIEGAWVGAYGSNGSGDYGYGCETNASGEYTITGLATGEYSVWCSAPSDSDYISKSSGSNVEVTAPDPTEGIDFTLAIGGSISGTVTDADGDTLEGIEVMVYRFEPYARPPGGSEPGVGGGDGDGTAPPTGETTGGTGPSLPPSGGTAPAEDETGDGAPSDDVDGQWVPYPRGHDETTQDGTYSIKGLEAGNFRIGFSDYSRKEYVAEYYSSDDGSAYTVENGSTIEVTSGAMTHRGIDAVLEKGGSISGHVTDGVAPMRGASVYAYGPDGKRCGYDGFTDDSGDYTIGGLLSGSYTVTCNPGNNYVPKTSDSEVPVTALIPIEGIDFVMTDKYGSVSGIVTDVDDTPIPGINLVLWRSNDDGSRTGTGDYTDENGLYRIDYLDTGDYMMEIWPAHGYIGGWYTESGTLAASSDSADTIHIEASANPTNAVIDVTLQPIPQTVTVSFDANGGAVGTPSKTVTVGESYGTLPVPTREGYNFDGWFTAASGGTQVTASTTVAEDASNHTLYAHWTQLPSQPQTVTVSFDAQGGAVSTPSTTVTVGEPYGALPTPTREGYTFDGWFTAALGGTRVTASTTVAEGATAHTLYAHWTQLPPQQGSGDPPASDPSTPPASTVTGTPAPVADIPAAKAPTAPGGASQLPPSVIFADGTRANVAWSSSDSSVASIDSAGNLVAASEGTVTLTATATDGSGKTQTITVTIAKPVTKIRTPLEAVYLKSGASIALPLCADSLDASGKADTDAKLSYESANPKIATVDANGKITAKKAGKTTVTVTALNGKSVKVKVNVTAKATPLKKFTLAKAPKTMKPGKAAQLKIKLTPAAATNLKVSFKSSKKGVATVDKAGKITAIKKGKTKITVKVGSKKTVITVTVK